MKKGLPHLVMAITLILGSCVSPRKAMDAKETALFNSWLHHSKAELMQAWGSPDSVALKENGGEILVYKEGVGMSNVMNENYTGTQFSYRKEIYINADSMIYYWKSFRRK